MSFDGFIFACICLLVILIHRRITSRNAGLGTEAAIGVLIPTVSGLLFIRLFLHGVM